MKTTVTPAQVTTVEDKIAGNMTFVQILFLVIPLISATIIYIVFPPKLHLSAVKFALMILQFTIFAPLAIRVKGKTLANWLVILLRFKLRPRIYSFTKNDLAAREITLAQKEKKQAERKVTEDQKSVKKSLSFKDQTRAEELLKHPAVTIRLGKKGGIDVALRSEE